MSAPSALSLIGAPAALSLGTIIHPGLSADAATQLELIARHETAWQVTHALGFVFVALMIPGIYALAEIARDGGPRLAAWGRALCIGGLVGWCAVVATYGLALGEMAAAGDRGAMVALFGPLTDAAIPARIVALGFSAGMACLCIALVQAGAASRPACAAVMAGLAGFAAGGQTQRVWLMTLGSALITTGLGAIAHRELPGLSRRPRLPARGASP